MVLRLHFCTTGGLRETKRKQRAVRVEWIKKFTAKVTDARSRGAGFI